MSLNLRSDQFPVRSIPMRHNYKISEDVNLYDKSSIKEAFMSYIDSTGTGISKESSGIRGCVYQLYDSVSKVMLSDFIKDSLSENLFEYSIPEDKATIFEIKLKNIVSVNTEEEFLDKLKNYNRDAILSINNIKQLRIFVDYYNKKKFKDIYIDKKSPSEYKIDENEPMKTNIFFQYVTRIPVIYEGYVYYITSDGTLLTFFKNGYIRNDKLGYYRFRISEGVKLDVFSKINNIDSYNYIILNTIDNANIALYSDPELTRFIPNLKSIKKYNKIYTKESYDIFNQFRYYNEALTHYEQNGVRNFTIDEKREKGKQDPIYWNAVSREWSGVEIRVKPGVIKSYNDDGIFDTFDDIGFIFGILWNIAALDEIDIMKNTDYTTIDDEYTQIASLPLLSSMSDKKYKKSIVNNGYYNDKYYEGLYNIADKYLRDEYFSPDESTTISSVISTTGLVTSIVVAGTVGLVPAIVTAGSATLASAAISGTRTAYNIIPTGLVSDSVKLFYNNAFNSKNLKTEGTIGKIEKFFDEFKIPSDNMLSVFAKLQDYGIYFIQDPVSSIFKIKIDKRVINKIKIIFNFEKPVNVITNNIMYLLFGTNDSENRSWVERGISTFLNKYLTTIRSVINIYTNYTNSDSSVGRHMGKIFNLFISDINDEEIENDLNVEQPFNIDDSIYTNIINELSEIERQ